jgi:hypothetical protein
MVGMVSIMVATASIMVAMAGIIGMAGMAGITGVTVGGTTATGFATGRT